MATVPQASAVTDVFYPESDGEPLGETGIHVQAILQLYALLDRRYAERTDVAVHADMFLYYVEGKPSACVCPDVFLTFGVPNRPTRRTFKVWQEGKAPDLVVEVTSASTIDVDLGRKLEIYRDRLQVAEYFLFDPETDKLDPPVMGFRRTAEGLYTPIQPVAGRWPSEVTGLHFEPVGLFLRPFDPRTGRRLLTDREESELAQSELNDARALLRDREAELARVLQELEDLTRRNKRTPS